MVFSLMPRKHGSSLSEAASFFLPRPSADDSAADDAAFARFAELNGGLPERCDLDFRILEEAAKPGEIHDSHCGPFPRGTILLIEKQRARHLSRFPSMIHYRHLLQEQI
jgi:hypothetical protein